MLERLRRRKGQEGFTLIELLVVVIIIGLLAAIAIPAFLGQRNKANDAAAKSLVRNGATAMEAYFSDGNSYAGATAANLRAIEPNIAWQITAADAAQDQLNFGTPTATTYSLFNRQQVRHHLHVRQGPQPRRRSLDGDPLVHPDHRLHRQWRGRALVAPRYDPATASPS